MKYFVLVLLLMGSALASDSKKDGFYSFVTKDIDGNEFKFDQFKGKVVLLVNIATQCGFTGQLDELESLYQKYKSRGLVVVGVPSNDFGGQTPEANAEVKKFCSVKYGVTFPLTEKAIVKGRDKVDYIAWLIDQGKKEEIGWNFVKFLVDKNGKLVDRYSSMTGPENKGLVKAIEKKL